MCLEQFSNCTVRNGSCYLRDHNELLHFLVITYEREKVTRLKSRILKRGGDSVAATASPDDEEESEFIRKISRNALFVLAKDEYNRILIVEEVLGLVPLVGAGSSKSFRPTLYSWHFLPNGTKIEQSSRVPSRYGVSELLLG